MTVQRFDVFLAHSSKDKLLIRQIYRKLVEMGIKPWLDEEEIPPGTSFQDELQRAIANIGSAAICIGSTDLGRWQALELKTFITQCVKRNIPVIPVLLPGVMKIPEELVFLQEFHAVSFQTGTEDAQALYRLVWGITGKKPISQTVPQVIRTSNDDNNPQSEVGINYMKLRNLLSSQKWKEADYETDLIIKKILYTIGPELEEGNYSNVSERIVHDFPCKDLLSIDTLWDKFSNSLYGFSSQIDIWNRLSDPTVPDPLRSFCKKVGWYYQDWQEYNDLDFTSRGPKGQFPTITLCVIDSRECESIVEFRQGWAHRQRISDIVSMGRLSWTFMLPNLIQRLKYCKERT